MKRFYVSKLVETYPATGETRTLPAIWNEVPAYVAITCPDAGYALVLAAGPDHTAAVADNRNIPLWDITLDTPLSIYNRQEQRRVERLLSQNGIAVTINWNQDTFRDFVTRLAIACNDAFDANRFDVSEPTG